MKGIIMAGGEGSRLRPLTCDLPKPMVPIMNKPVMEYSIQLLKKHGIRDIGVTLQYLPGAIKNYFGHGFNYGINLNYYIEETPLGTAGSVKNAEKFLTETFVVISGDALTDINLTEAMTFHREKNALVTMILKKVDVPLEYGVVLTDEEGAITGFLEKPNWGEVFSDTVNTGIYILEPEALDYFEYNTKFDFSKDLFPMILKDQKPMYGYIADGYWCDIGDVESYMDSHIDIMKGCTLVDLNGKTNETDIWIEKGAYIHPKAILEGPCYIGQKTEIDEGVRLGPYAVIGDNIHIGPYSSIKRSVLWGNSVLGRSVALRGTIICNNINIGNNADIYEGSVIGDNVTLHRDVVIKPGAKIWPHKIIGQGTTIKDNLVWGVGIRKNLFGDKGLSGFLGTEINPWLMSRLGMALGSLIGKGAKVALSHDGHRASLMLKSGLVAGLLAGGLDVIDIGITIAPIARFGVRTLNLDSGVHIRFCNRDLQRAYIQVFDKRGANLSASLKRNLENIIHIGDTPLKSREHIGKINYVKDIETFYISSLVNSIQEKNIENNTFKIAVIDANRYQKYLFSKLGDSLKMDIHFYEGPLHYNTLKSPYDLIVGLDVNGEKAILYTDDGSSLVEDKMVALISLLCFKQDSSLDVAIPYTASQIVDRMAKTYRSKTIRTKSRKESIMEEVLRIGNSSNRVTIDRFRLYFDGIAQVVGIINLMVLENKSFADLIKEIPKSNICQKNVYCPQTSKGKVMRTLIEDAYTKQEDIELFEGVKIQDEKGWALILPDSDEPLCKVYSEGLTEEYAGELLDFYEEEINRIKKL